MIKRKKIFLLLIVFSVFLLSVMAVSAEDISVDSNKFDDLNNAIQNANPDDTIILNKNITENLQTITIEKNITSNGQNNYIDENYIKSTKDNSTLNIDVNSAVMPDKIYVDVNLTYTNGTPIADFINIETYDIDGKRVSIKNVFVDGFKTINITPFSAGIYNVVVIYKGNDTINPCSSSASFYLKKASIGMDLLVDTITYGEDCLFEIMASNNITDTVNVFVNGEFISDVDLKDGYGSLFLNNYNAGTYTITVSYAGSRVYEAGNFSTTWTVNKANVIFERIILNDIVYGETTPFIIQLSENITDDFYLLINDQIAQPRFINGVFVSNLTADADTYGITIFYLGNNNYNGVAQNLVWHVAQKPVEIELNIDDISYGETGVLTIDLDQEISVPVTLVVCGHVIKTIDLVNGHAQTDLTGFDAGDHIITVIFEGTQNYALARNSSNWTVEKADTTLIIDSEDIIYGQDETITVYVGNNLDGIVTLNGLGDNEVIVYVYKGVGSITLSDLKPGNYDIDALFIPIDSNYDVQVNDTSFTVTDKEETTVIVDIKDVYYIGDIINETVSVLPSDATGRIEIYYNDTYITHLDLVNGSAVFTDKVPDIPGYWKIDVVYTGDEYYYESKVSKNVLVMSKDNILIVDDLEKYYSQDYPLIAKLLDCNGIPLSDEIITFTINGKTYTRTTNSNGIAIMNINLQPGDYTVEVASGNLTKTVNVDVLNTIYAEDVVKMYKNDTQYYAYFTDSNGLALANTNVTFNINGVFYTRTTNASGVARLNINLQPGNYVITAYNPETGESFSNNITINSPIVGSDLTKKYSEVGVYTVLAYDNQGNPLANATITININGVFYNRVTDETGIARLNINLAPGEYIATAYYNGALTSNKITVLDA